jgi:hypothetical protein
MSQWLTDTDQERIEAFAERPAYERRPDMLLPREGEDES